MRLPDLLKLPILLLVLAGIVGVVLTAGCAEAAVVVAPCTFVATPRTDSTAVVTYKDLPCYDAAYGRVVRKR